MLLAQAISGGDAPTPLTSLVFGALGSSPAPLILAWVVTRGDKEKADLRADLTKEREENRRLNELRTDSAKEMATLLERAATTFAEVNRELRSLLRERSGGKGQGS